MSIPTAQVASGDGKPSTMTVLLAPEQAGWRRPLTFTLSSLFLLWHSVVLLIGCLPTSYLVTSIYPVFAPYIETLHLDNGWAFFAPDPGTGKLVRYRVQSADGRVQAYRLTENLQRRDPAYFRLTTLSANIKADHPEVLSSVTRRLCYLHAQEKPQSIRFTLARQMRITPEEYEAGHRPLDADFLDLEDLPAVNCPS